MSEKGAKDRLPAKSASSIPVSFQDNAGYLLNRAARIIRESITDALRPLKLTPRDVGVLRLLNERGATSQHELGQRDGIDRTTVVEIIDGLQQQELVMRVVNPQDRRRHFVHLTPRGRKVLAQADRLVKKEQDRFLAPLQPAQWETVRSALVKLIEDHDS